MKAPVSLDYLVAVILLAVACAVVSFISPSPAFNLASLLLGVYALHLVSLRVVLRQWAKSGHWSKHLKGHHLAEIRTLRDELESDRRELDNRKAELQQRIDAAEQQWELLRQMIRDRVEGGVELPDTVAIEQQTVWTATTAPSPGNGSSDDPPRIHGRW